RGLIHGSSPFDFVCWRDAGTGISGNSRPIQGIMRFQFQQKAHSHVQQKAHSHVQQKAHSHSSAKSTFTRSAKSTFTQFSKKHIHTFSKSITRFTTNLYRCAASE